MNTASDKDDLKDIHHTRELARFLESLPIRSLVHLTSPRPLTNVEWDSLVAVWHRTLQSQDRQTIAWIRSDEPRPRHHVHLALIAAGPINNLFAAELWRLLVGPRSRTAARIEPYVSGGGGLSYILKGIDKNQCDVRFSTNIAYFGVSRLTRASSAAERRQLRRVGEQIEGHHHG